jgi:hypothetical protein
MYILIFVIYITICIFIFLFGVLKSIIDILDYQKYKQKHVGELSFCVIDKNDDIKFSISKCFLNSFLWFRHILKFCSF